MRSWLRVPAILVLLFLWSFTGNNISGQQPCPVPFPFQSVTITYPVGVNGNPNETVPVDFLAAGAVSPLNSIVYGVVLDLNGTPVSAIQAVQAVNGGWVFQQFKSPAGNPLAGNTSYILWVWVGDFGDSHEIEIKTK